MFGIEGSELAVIAIVALVVIGPKDLPRVMRFVGQWVGKGRAMSRHVRAGFDTMMREAELEEMQKQWDAQNAAIIASTNVDYAELVQADHSQVAQLEAPPQMLPLAEPAAATPELIAGAAPVDGIKATE